MTDAVALHTIFEPDQIFEAPLFQRRYRWSPTGSRRELARFWDDISDLENETTESLFLGAIITKPSQPSSTTRAARFSLIDGQQRLTTIFLTILAAAVELLERGYETDSERLISSYLGIANRREDRALPKMIVTTPDVAEYAALIRNAKSQNIRFGTLQPHRQGLMTRCFDYARLQIKNRIVNKAPEITDSEAILNLIDLILAKAELVEIQLEPRHDPSEVFDRLNREGAPLTVADLVRNHVFGKLSGNRVLAQNIHSQLWEPFEQRLDDAIDNYFFPFALIRDPQTTKSRSMNALEQYWNDLNREEADHEQQIKNIVDDIELFVPAFLCLTAGRDYAGLPRDVAAVARRLYRMNPPSVILPFPMRVLEAAASGELDLEQAAESLTIVEAFLVRRAFVGLEPTGLHTVFKVLWDRSAGADPAKVRKELEARSMRFPGDDIVRSNIMREPLYGRRLCHYIMEEYEVSLRRGDRLSATQLSGFTIDHVAPQSLKGEWADVFRDAEEKLIGSWGNLVPLSQAANSTKSTMSWSDAQDLLRRDTIYKSTMTIYEDYEQWTPSEIEDRNRELAEWAIGQWPSFSHHLP